MKELEASAVSSIRVAISEDSVGYYIDTFAVCYVL